MREELEHREEQVQAREDEVKRARRQMQAHYNNIRASQNDNIDGSEHQKESRFKALRQRELRVDAKERRLRVVDGVFS